MEKPRFRDIKQGKSCSKSTPAGSKKVRHQGPLHATKGSRTKAFITDSFMLLMPIMYVVFYLIFDGREGFAEQMLTGWAYILLPLIIAQVVFLSKSGQTPGMRAYHITLVDLKTGEKPLFGILLYRQFLTLLSLITLGWIIMFFRKDHRPLHDLLAGTTLLHTDKHKQTA